MPLFPASHAQYLVALLHAIALLLMALMNKLVAVRAVILLHHILKALFLVVMTCRVLHVLLKYVSCLLTLVVLKEY